MRVLISGFWIVLSLITFMFAADMEPGKPAADFSLLDATGNTHKLTDYKGKIVVLEWVNFGCPFVKKHYKSGNMQMLQKKYTDKDVIWLSICSSAQGKQGYLEAGKIKEVLADKKARPTAYLVDEDGKVGRLYGAKTTPHMFIINQNGMLLYKGAIDDIRSVDVKDIKKANNFVSSTLDKLLKGKKVKPFQTTAYGCSVKYK